MGLYLTRAKYSPEAFKAMIANPSDREAAGRAMFEAAGVKLHHMWFSTNGEVITIAEGDPVARSTIGMVVMASGGFSDGESTELITMSQMTEAMKGAGAVAAKFRPPGK
jgi:uncharacterized protein with GYD domain